MFLFKWYGFARNKGGTMEASKMLRDVREMRSIVQKVMDRLDALEAEILRPPVAVFVEGAVCTPTASVDVLRLPARSARILREMGIRTIAELVVLSDHDILKQKSAGKATLWQIKDSLRGVGYQLKS